MSDELIAAVLDTTRGNIEKNGWSGISVFPTADEPDGPTFEYTVGLTETYGHPELVIYGLASSTMHGILWSAVEVIAAGTRLTPGRHERVLRGFDVEVREAQDAEARVARVLYGDDVEVVQLLWPDAAGKFPGEEGCDADTARVQERTGR